MNPAAEKNVISPGCPPENGGHPVFSINETIIPKIQMDT